MIVSPKAFASPARYSSSMRLSCSAASSGARARASSSVARASSNRPISIWRSASSSAAPVVGTEEATGVAGRAGGGVSPAVVCVDVAVTACVSSSSSLPKSSATGRYWRRRCQAINSPTRAASRASSNRLRMENRPPPSPAAATSRSPAAAIGREPSSPSVPDSSAVSEAASASRASPSPEFASDPEPATAGPASSAADGASTADEAAAAASDSGADASVSLVCGRSTFESTAVVPPVTSPFCGSPASTVIGVGGPDSSSPAGSAPFSAV